MARLLTRDGDEICWLAHLVIEGQLHGGSRPLHRRSKEHSTRSILQTDGAHYQVIIQLWDFQCGERGHVERVCRTHCGEDLKSRHRRGAFGARADVGHGSRAAYLRRPWGERRHSRGDSIQAHARMTRIHNHSSTVPRR